MSTKGMKKYTDGTSIILLHDGDVIPDGFYKGVPTSVKEKVSSTKKGKSPSNKGLICYTDGTKNIYVHEGETIPEGFYKGFSYKSESSKQQRVDKTASTKLELYGDDKYNNIQKAKQTNLQRYGCGSPLQNDDVQKKIKETNIERYGCENLFSSDDIKDKIKNTLLERYGVDNISKSDNNRQKIKNYWKSLSEEQLGQIQQSKKERCLQLYGVENPSMLQETKDKMRETCLEKYGVPFFCMSEKARSSGSMHSKPNDLFAQKLDDAGILYEREFVLGKYSYDFKVNSTLIEINPSATHNSTWGIFGKQPVSKDYHKDKTQEAIKHGFNCICLWDWDDADKIVKMFLKRETVYARDCCVELVDSDAAYSFEEEFHLQGKAKSTINIALKYNGNIVSLMTFDVPRYNKNYDYELVRYCYSHHVTGGAEKLLKHFIEMYKPSSIISYCDLSKFTGKLYENLGFQHINTTVGRHWYNAKTGRHITDNLLRQRGFDQLFNTDYGKDSSNTELMLLHNFVEVFDCGQSTYVLDICTAQDGEHR